MNKVIYGITIIAATLLVGGIPNLATAEVQIQASFFPYAEFTRNVAGDTATVSQFLPVGAGPHDWEPSIRQVQTLSSANIIVYNGLGVDMFIDRLLESGDLSDTHVIKATEGLTLLSTGISDAIAFILEEHEHGHYDDDEAIDAMHDVIDDYNIRDILQDYRAGDLSTTEALGEITAILRGAEHGHGHDHDDDHMMAHDDHDDHDDDHMTATDDHDDDHMAHDDHDDHHDDDAEIVHEVHEILEEAEEGHLTNAEALEEIEHLLDDHAHDDHDDHGDEHAHDHGIYDPHVWLDPVLAQHQVETIRDGLVDADPDNAAAYMANAESYLHELEDLHDQYVTTLADCRHDTIVTFHSAFAYLVERYDLQVESLTGLDGADAISTADLIELADFINDNDIDYILTEFGVDQRNFEVIAEETNTTVLTLSPVEGISQEDVDSGATYISKMTENLGVLKTALDCN